MVVALCFDRRQAIAVCSVRMGQSDARRSSNRMAVVPVNLTSGFRIARGWGATSPADSSDPSSSWHRSALSTSLPGKRRPPSVRLGWGSNCLFCASAPGVTWDRACCPAHAALRQVLFICLHFAIPSTGDLRCRRCPRSRCSKGLIPPLRGGGAKMRRTSCARRFFIFPTECCERVE